MAKLFDILYTVQNHTTSTQLVNGVDFNIQVDPSAGNVTLTLDTASTARRPIRVKRITNGGNWVKVLPKAGDSIDGVTTGFILGGRTEWVDIYPDGTTAWRRSNQRTFAFASILITSPVGFSLTTGYTNFTGWDFDAFSTPGRIEGDAANNQLAIIDFQGPATDGFHFSGHLNFEFTNNKTVTGQLYDTDAAAYIGQIMSVNADGPGKPVSMIIDQTVAITSITNIQLHLLGESAGTLTPVSAFLLAERIGG